MYQDFEALVTGYTAKKLPMKVAVVAGANDAHALEAVFEAEEKGYAKPLLVGDRKKVVALINELGYGDRNYKLVDIADGANPSAVAVKLIREGKGDFIIKGKLETRDLLKPILNKETGLNSNGFVTHFGYMQLKGYHKLVAISDCAVIPHPTLEEKEKILQIGVDSLKKLGCEKPIVGILCAVESVSEKMPETVEAEQIAKRAAEGVYGECAVMGPISYDLATRKESAQVKGYDSPYAGEVDLLIVPNMVTGNIMSKIWNADEENIMAGCLVGTDIPIALYSRSASMNEKLNSILLCAILCE